jgi:hypothetical protein
VEFKYLWDGSRRGLAGVIRRFWVVPNPEIDFRLPRAPVNPQVGGFGNELAKSILFEQSREKLVPIRAVGKTNRLLLMIF